jgi:hypothetical protein
MLKMKIVCKIRVSYPCFYFYSYNIIEKLVKIQLIKKLIKKKKIQIIIIIKR